MIYGGAMQIRRSEWHAVGMVEGHPVTFISLNQRRGGWVELGWHTSHEHWGRGFGSRTVRDFVLQYPHPRYIVRIMLETNPCGKFSERVALHAGFVRCECPEELRNLDGQGITFYKQEIV